MRSACGLRAALRLGGAAAERGPAADPIWELLSVAALWPATRPDFLRGTSDAAVRAGLTCCLPLHGRATAPADHVLLERVLAALHARLGQDAQKQAAAERLRAALAGSGAAAGWWELGESMRANNLAGR